jgi:hypothetical protein
MVSFSYKLTRLKCRFLDLNQVSVRMKTKLNRVEVSENRTPQYKMLF